MRIDLIESDVAFLDGEVIEISTPTESPYIPPETIEACARIFFDAQREKLHEQTHSGFEAYERFFELHYGKDWRNRRQGRRGDCQFCSMTQVEVEQWRKDRG